MRGGQENAKKHISYVLQENIKIITLKFMLEMHLNNSVVQYY